MSLPMAITLTGVLLAFTGLPLLFAADVVESRIGERACTVAAIIAFALAFVSIVSGIWAAALT